MNKSSEGRLAKVHPALAERIRLAADALLEQGIAIEVVQGLRSYAEQNALYAQGRTKPGKRVTNARAGFSNHNFGLAVDVCPFAGGKALWDAPESTWEKIGEAGEAEGLEWGGRWVSLVDLPHLQLPGLTIAQCRTLYEAGGLPRVWASVKLKTTPTEPENVKNGHVEPIPPEPPKEEITEKVITTTTTETPDATIEKKSIISSITGNDKAKEIAGTGLTTIGNKLATGGISGGVFAAVGAFLEKAWPVLIFATVLIILGFVTWWFIYTAKQRQKLLEGQIAADPGRKDISFGLSEKK